MVSYRWVTRTMLILRSTCQLTSPFSYIWQSPFYTVFRVYCKIYGRTYILVSRIYLSLFWVQINVTLNQNGKYEVHSLTVSKSQDHRYRHIYFGSGELIFSTLLSTKIIIDYSNCVLRAYDSWKKKLNETKTWPQSQSLKVLLLLSE